MSIAGIGRLGLAVASNLFAINVQPTPSPWIRRLVWQSFKRCVSAPDIQESLLCLWQVSVIQKSMVAPLYVYACL